MLPINFKKPTSIIVLFFLIFSITYWFKAKYLNISFLPGHLGDYLEKYSFGLLNCQWFPNPHHCALLRSDIFERLVLLSVPYIPRLEVKPTIMMQEMAGDKQFYQLYFQEQGLAEVSLEKNVRNSLLSLLYSASGDAPPEKRWRFLFDKSENMSKTIFLPDNLPNWLSEEDLDFFTQEFERTGFRGGLNWYRNLDLNWEFTPFLRGAKIQQPTWFIGGELDAVITIYREAFDNLEENVLNLREKVLLPGIGHWIQQEAYQDVNRLLIDYLTRR